MRVFITGATGFVGTAVVAELNAAGHTVLGLARSDASAAALVAAGAEPVRGTLDDLDVLRTAAAASDGVIHAGFVHDFSSFEAFNASAAIDRRAIEAIGAALERSGKPFVVTAGTMHLLGTPHGTENDPPSANISPRTLNEAVALAFAEKGVRVSIMRLPQVHGPNDHAFIPRLIAAARAASTAAYIGDGANRWPAAHLFDVARLYRLALENAAAGTRVHAVADEGVPLKAITEIIGRRLGLPVVSMTPEQAKAQFGWFVPIVAADNYTSSALTKERLGWTPTEVGLLEDLDQEHYFKV